MNNILTFLFVLTLFGLSNGESNGNSYDYSMTSTCTTQDGDGCMEWTHRGTIKEKISSSCFPENTYVITSNGIVQMKDLSIGNNLLGYNTNTDTTEFSEMPTWFHYDRISKIPYMTVSTNDGSITSSGSHNIAFINDNEDDIFYKYTSSISDSDSLIGFTFDKNNLEYQSVGEHNVIKIEEIEQVGMYAPYTRLHNYFVSDDGKNFYLAHLFAHITNPTRYEYVVSAIFNPLSRFYTVDEIQDVYFNPIAKSLYNIMSLYEYPITSLSELRRRLNDDDNLPIQPLATGYNLFEASTYLSLLVHTHTMNARVNGTATR
jgi:hypothetical protein